MKIIKPITITDAMLTSSTLAETDYATWSSGTTYASGAYVILTSTHRIYKSLQSANTNHTPTEAASLWWVDVGPTNKWAMFDAVVNTQSAASTTLTVVLAPGRINSLALMNMSAEGVVVTMTSGAETVYSYSASLLSGMLGVDWFSYFFEEIGSKTDLVLTDIPTYSDGVITITLSGASILVGVLAVGISSDLGDVETGAKTSIVNYSRKDTDTFGNTVITQRRYAKKMQVNLLLTSDMVNGVATILSSIRSTPVVWAGSDEYTSMVVYGFYRDFEVDINTGPVSYCSLQIEGLI